MGVLIALIGLGGVAVATLRKPSERTQAIVEHGLELYQASYCGVCHTLDAAGTKSIFGPPHNALSVIAGARISDASYTGTAKTAEDYIRESITHPDAYIVPGYAVSKYRMPAFINLSQENLDALVQMLLQQ